MAAVSNVLGLKFSPSLRNGELKIIALPKEVEESIERGEEICFKTRNNDGDGKTVLCTDKCTYSIMQVESSNTSLLADLNSKKRNPKDDAGIILEISDTFESTYELFIEVPDFTPLRKLLQNHVFSVDGGDDDNADRGLSLDEIAVQTCASAKEIPQYLASDPAVLAFGEVGLEKFYFVEDEVLDYHFDVLLSTIMSMRIPLRGSGQIVDDVVSKCDLSSSGGSVVVLHLIATLRPAGSAGRSLQASRLLEFELDPSRVANFRMRYLLRQDLSKVWKLKEFIEACATDCPLECEKHLTPERVIGSGVALCRTSKSASLESTTVTFVDSPWLLAAICLSHH